MLSAAIASPATSAPPSDDPEVGSSDSPYTNGCRLDLATAVRATLPISGGNGHFSSGVVVGTDTMITVAHGVRPDASPWADLDGTQVPATIISEDRNLDIAVLDVPTTGVRPMSKGEKPVDLGTKVVLVGHPDAGPRQLTAGIVSRMAGKRIYIDAQVKEGYSGGAIMHCDDEKWRLAGILVGYLIESGTTPNVAVGVTAASLEVDRSPLLQ